MVTEGAQVRLLLWLGLEKDQEKWKEHCGSGEIAVFAETVSSLYTCACMYAVHTVLHMYIESYRCLHRLAM